MLTQHVAPRREKNETQVEFCPHWQEWQLRPRGDWPEATLGGQDVSSSLWPRPQDAAGLATQEAGARAARREGLPAPRAVATVLWEAPSRLRGLGTKAGGTPGQAWQVES